MTISLELNVVRGSLTESFGAIGVEGTWREPRADPGPLEDVKRSSALLFDVMPAAGPSWFFASGQRFLAIPGTIKVLPLQGEFDPKSTGIGPLRFVLDEDDEIDTTRWYAEVVVPEAQYLSLCASAQSGRIPSSIRLELRGHKGLGDNWDLKQAPFLRIAKIDFTVPLAIRDVAASSSDEMRPSHMTPTDFHVLRFSSALNRLEHLSARALVHFRWMLLALVALLALLISGRLR